MKQRSTFDITTCILEATASSRNGDGMTKTAIMQIAMLNYPRVNRYCSRLVHTGLIELDSKNQCFKITEKGREVLKLSKELAEYITPIQRMINKYSFLSPISSSYEREVSHNALVAF